MEIRVVMLLIDTLISPPHEVNSLSYAYLLWQCAMQRAVIMRSTHDQAAEGAVLSALDGTKRHITGVIADTMYEMDGRRKDAESAY